MILTPDQWHLGYDQILQDCRRSSTGAGAAAAAVDTGTTAAGSVLILCNMDADALCAARIWSYLLRNDNVPYQLRPCSSYRRLYGVLDRVVGGGGKNKNKRPRNEDANVLAAEDQDDDEEDMDDDMTNRSDVRAVILLNLGANRNLTRLFYDSSDPQSSANNKEDEAAVLDERSGTAPRLYVLDCRRPFHLGNVHAGRNVVLFWDRNWDGDDGVPSDGDNLSGDESSSDEEEDDSDEDDSDEDSEEEESDGDQEHEFQDSDDDGGAEFDDGEDDGEEGTSGRARRRNRRNAATTPEAKRIRRSSGGDGDQDDDLAEDDASDGTPPSQPPSPEGEDDRQGDDRQDAAENGDGNDDDQPPQPSFRDLHRARRNRIRLYYSLGSTYGSPVSWITYDLTTRLRGGSRYGDVPDLLWLAIVGVSDARRHHRLDLGGYAALALELRRHVTRLFPNDALDRAGRAVYAERLEDGNPQDDGGGFGGGSGNGDRTQIGLSENGRILCESEYRFALLRHTSLWDAMVHSDYVACRLRTYKETGRQRLKELLAKMGFPLNECRQPYAFMRPALRRRLREQVDVHAEEFGLENVSYTGFVRVTGYKSLLSACDMSHAVTALLECDTPETTASAGASVVEDDNEDNNSAEAQERIRVEREERALLQSFNAAYDALNAHGSGSSGEGLGPGGASMMAGVTDDDGGGGACEGSDLSTLVNGGSTSTGSGLGAGLRLAMNLQRAVLSAAVGLVDRNAITRLSHFRYAYLRCTAGQEGSVAAVTPDNGGGARGSSPTTHHIFARPLALTRLAHFLMEMHRENGRWTGTKSRPLVLLAEKPSTSTFMVVGYECEETGSAGGVVRNRFGQNFELVAKSMRGTFWFDSFDSNVVEVDGKDVQRFIEQLHNVLDRMERE